jgi:hypothetical protein
MREHTKNNFLGTRIIVTQAIKENYRIKDSAPKTIRNKYEQVLKHRII